MYAVSVGNHAKRKTRNKRVVLSWMKLFNGQNGRFVHQKIKMKGRKKVELVSTAACRHSQCHCDWKKIEDNNYGHIMVVFLL